MTDAPETIWVTKKTAINNWLRIKSLEKSPRVGYRRADLPATNAQANENENVKVMVGLLEYLNQAGGLGLGKHQLIRAALAAMKETDDD